MANITRDQYSENKGVVRKVLQQEVPLLDSDFNEAHAVIVNSDRRHLSSLVNHDDRRFGDGFKVTGDGSELQVTVLAGFMAVHLATNSAALIRLASAYVLSGFSTWVGEGLGRTDCVYVDVWEVEYGPSDDPNIVNPALGSESMLDIRIKYEFKIAERATTAPTPATGHTHVVLALVEKLDENDHLYDNQVINQVADHHEQTGAELTGMNLLLNSELIFWTGGVSQYPDSWDGINHSAIAREDTIVKASSHAVKLTADGPGLVYFHQDLEEWGQIAGKLVNGVIWIQFPTDSTAAYAFIDDGHEVFMGELTSIVADTWTMLKVRAQLHNVPTRVRFGVRLGPQLPSGAVWPNYSGQDYYVDAAALYLGDYERVYEPDLRSHIDLARKFVVSFGHDGQVTSPTYFAKNGITADGWPMPFRCKVISATVYHTTPPTSGGNSYEIMKGCIGSSAAPFGTIIIADGEKLHERNLDLIYEKGERLSVLCSGTASNPGSTAFVCFEIIPWEGGSRWVA
jgi:hypothetical protein